MKGKIKGAEELAKELSMYPKEQLVKRAEGANSLVIGLPRELDPSEHRICLTPDAVALLVNNGHQVLVETGAGSEAKFSDHSYSEAGATIVYSHDEVFAAEIVLKVEPPTTDEVSKMKQGKTIISALQMAKTNAEFVNALVQRKVIAVAYEFLEDKVGGKPIVRSMSEIAGSTVMLIAAEYLSSVNGMGVVLGGITGVSPVKVVILGAGTVAEYAARTAIGLGAQVKVFDNHLYRLSRLKHDLGQQIYTSTLDTGLLKKEIIEADVVVGSLRPDEGMSAIVTEDIVREMKADSVIIDVSIDQGGCIETSELTSHLNPVFRKYDVIHYCVPNIPSRVAQTASIALSNIFTPILLQIGKKGGVEEMMFAKEWFMKGIYAYKGNLTNAYLGKRFGLIYKDLNLLMAARF